MKKAIFFLIGIIIFFLSCSILKTKNNKTNKLLILAVEELKRKKIVRDIDISDTILISFKDSLLPIENYLLSSKGLQQLTKKQRISVSKKYRDLTFFYCKWTQDGDKYITDTGYAKYTSMWKGVKLNFNYNSYTYAGYFSIENKSIIDMLAVRSDN